MTTPAEQAKRLAKDLPKIERDLGLRGSFYDFVKMAWPIAEAGTPYVDNWHVGCISEHLQALTELQLRYLVLNVPPGCMKSRLTGLFWPVWTWIRDSGYSRWGNWSFDLGLVLREAEAVYNLISTQWFQARWSDRVRFEDRSPAMGEFWTPAKGLMFASTTPKGDATGWHFDYWRIDDPHKPQTMSKVTLEESRRWWYQTLPSRKRTPATHRGLLVMQRLHETDMSALAQEDGWYMLRIPMRWERPKYSIPSSPIPVAHPDPRREQGELLWPARFDEVEVKKLEKRLGVNGTASQLQQRPAPEGGATFRRDWFRTWVAKGAPTGHIADAAAMVGGSPIFKELPEQFDETIVSIDCAFKKLDDSDFVCIQVWGRKGEDFFLLDQDKDRMRFADTCQAVLAISQKWPYARPILIEDKANGSAVIDVMTETVPGIEPVNPDGGKESRANAVTGAYKGGHVYHPDPEFYPWVLDHRNELASFPYAANDDQVDAMSQALVYLMKSFMAFEDAMAKFGKIIVPQAGQVATKEEEKDVTEMLDLLYGLNRVL